MTPEIIYRLELAELAELRKVASRAHWYDGAASAQGDARKVKRCSSAAMPMDAITGPILQRLIDCQRLQDVALPRRATPFRLVRYEAGDYYGPHADIIANATGFRCDFSLTIMLEPAALGGELSIEMQNGWRSLPLQPGDCLLYPSTTVHQVFPVELGPRVVIIAWLESFVRELERRAVLAQLERLCRGELEPSPAHLQALRQELLRQWVT